LIDLDQVKGQKGPAPRGAWLFAALTVAVVGYSVIQHHWSDWLLFGSIAVTTLLSAHSLAMAMLKAERKTGATWKQIALIVALISFIAGVIFTAFGLSIRDAVTWTLIDPSRTAWMRAIAASVMVLLLARYLYGLKNGLRCSYGSVEILGAVAIVWFTADFGPKAAPTVPLFVLGLLSGAFLVVQGVENIKAGLSGNDDLLAALMLDLFPAPTSSIPLAGNPTTMSNPSPSGPPPGFHNFDDATIAAQKILLVVADTLVLSVEKYSGWLITGFAAIAALVVANNDQVVKATHDGIPKLTVWLFLWATAVHALQRLINAFVQSATGAGREGEKLGDLLASSQDPHVLPRMMLAVQQSYPSPLHYLIGLSFTKLLRGDLLFMPRLILRAAILSVLLLVAQIAVAMAAIWKIAAAL